MITQRDNYIKKILIVLFGIIMSANTYPNKSISNFKNIVVVSSSKFYEDDKLYIKNLHKLNMVTDDDNYVYKNIKVDFLYDVFYKKMQGEGFLIQISSDKSRDLDKADIDDLVFILEKLLDIDFFENDKNQLLLAKDKNTPKFKIVKNKYDLWFDFYPKSKNSNSYFECIIAITK